MHRSITDTGANLAEDVVKRGRGRPPGSRNKPRVNADGTPVAKQAKPARQKAVVAKPIVKEAHAPKAIEPVAAADPVAAIAAPVEPAVRETIEQEKVLAAEPAEAGKKEMDEMANAAETMTAKGAKAAEAGADRAKVMFGDLNDRAKSAMEKSSKVFEDVVEFSKGNVEAAVASGRAVAKGTEALLQDATDYGRTSFEKVQGAAKSYASVKSPTEFMQLHSDFSRSMFDAMVAETSRLSEAYVKVMSDVVAPISSRFSLAAEKFKSASL